MTLSPDALALTAALPWLLTVVGTLWRWRDAPSLDDVDVARPAPALQLTVILPARNEARHVGECVRSILASTYPHLALIVVDDHSTDGTGALASAAAGGDPRFTVIVPPPLPVDWLGKQWACAQGARAATADVLLFTDADVRHAPDLHERAVRMMERERADLLSVAGHQETVTFWERIVQPFVFSVLAQMYGGPGAVNRSRRARGKIANGQFLLFRRDAYDAFGGHDTVKARAAEDLAFAQQMFARGFRTRLVLGIEQMSTRMYSSFREIADGWGKNVYAAGREALPFGRVAPVLAAALVPFPAIFTLTPVLALLAGILGLGTGTVARSLALFGATASLVQLLWFVAVAWRFRIPPLYAALYPLGAAVYLYIALGAVARGSTIAWKGRTYRVDDAS